MSLRRSVKDMSNLMDKMGLTELEAENSLVFGLFRRHIHLSKVSHMTAQSQQVQFAAPIAQAPVAISAPKSEVAAPAAKAAAKPAVKSPMVGVAYLSPEPGAKPFIEVGKSVKAGDTICLIEAMKTFNPVKSEKDGVIKEILIKDGEAVEFDTPLVVIE